MEFEVKKELSTSGKVKWVYCFKENGKRKERVCKNCTSEAEAITFAKKIGIKKKNPYLISEIAKDMYKEGSEHLARLEGFGKKLTKETLQQKRYIIESIISDFGDTDISKLLIRDIELFLIQDLSHSGSWKNFYLETFGSIYEETKWMCPKHINKPKFQRFIRNSKKADILTTEELNLIFNPKKWRNYSEYLLFILIASCGLRIGEARGLTVNQFMFTENILVINGFCKRNGEKTNYNKKGSVDNDKIRVIPIPNTTAQLVQNFIKSKKLRGKDFLFTMDDGSIYRQDHLEYVFKKIIKSTGINTNDRKIVPHSLRFTYVTRMRRQLPIENVQRIVGHSSIEMTQYYTRSSIPELIESVKDSFDSANNIFN